MLAILVLAAVARVYDLGDVPPGFFCDEAGNGYNSYSILKTGRDENRELFPLYVWSFGVAYKNPVFIYASILPIAIFGLSEFSVRLTSALFGVLAVAASAWLGRLMFGAAGGLLAALLLAVCPWHWHFSRIAFELIALPPLVLAGFAALVTGIRGRPRWLLGAAAFFALSLYAYAPAKLFVPAFLLGAAVAYARRMWAAGRWTVLAALLGALLITPLVMFDVVHRDRSQQYFSRTTNLNAAQPVRENAERVLRYYSRFFSRGFLFERGDPLGRHAVPQFGELYWSMAPLMALGLLWALWPGHPEGKLLLWWLVLYPIAPSLMNEIPSASRGFIGVAAFCLLAAAGGATVLRVLSWLIRWPRAALAAQVLAAAAFLAVLGQEAWRYWQAYTTKYPAYAARDFQYGYREAIQFMESRRKDYDLLLLTANNVNQPQIFTAFYNATDPRQWQRTQNAGYLIIDPSEYGRYEMNQRILAALRLADLPLFQDYTELHRVLTPGGAVEYVIADVRTRRRFITEWLLLGPFDNPKGAGLQVDFISPDHVARRAHTGAFGAAYWRRVVPQFVRVDFNSFYHRTAEQAGRPLEWLCAYAVTQLEVPEARAAVLEFAASHQPAQIWLEGRPLMAAPAVISTTARRLRIRLHAGPNEMLVKLCKTTGDWNFTARVTDSEGRDLDPLIVRPVLRREAATVATAAQAPQQLVDGFDRVLQFREHSPRYSDYRGDSEGWWEHLGDPDGAVVWETDPVPERAPTVFAFTAAMSEPPGEAELWVNGHYALTFSTGRFPKARRWEHGPYALEFVPRESGHNLSGYWLLQVPEGQITAGKPVELRVAHVAGSPHAFFMIKGRQDTAAHESLTLDGIQVSGAGGRVPEGDRDPDLRARTPDPSAER